MPALTVAGDNNPIKTYRNDDQLTTFIDLQSSMVPRHPLICYLKIKQYIKLRTQI